MTFKEYLTGKKIDAGLFGKKEPSLYGKLKKDFDQMHPDSFTLQKLYLINPIRRKYRLQEEDVKTSVKKEKKMKPKIPGLKK